MLDAREGITTPPSGRRNIIAKQRDLGGGQYIGLKSSGMMVSASRMLMS